MSEANPNRMIAPDVNKMTVSEQRDFYKSATESMLGLVVWTLEQFGSQHSGTLVFVRDEKDEEHGTIKRWQDRFFDRMDEIGYVVDRNKYYSDVARQVLPEDGEDD